MHDSTLLCGSLYALGQVKIREVAGCDWKTGESFGWSKVRGGIRVQLMSLNPMNCCISEVVPRYLCYR